jgi:hypothetical protein
MRSLILVVLLLCASSAFAQTTVPVQNGSFTANPPAGNYNYSCPTGWTCKGSYFGMQNPTSAQIPGIASGTTTLWLQNAAATQDIGPTVANTNYSLSVTVGSQAGFSGNYTISYAGCTILGSTISGIVQPVTLPCSSPTGEIVISLASTQGQIQFTNVSLTIPGAFVFVLQNCGIVGSTCTFTFPIAAAPSLPSCTSADGTCVLNIQVCDTSVTPVNCLTLSTSGAANIVKTSSTNGITVTPLVTATNP